MNLLVVAGKHDRVREELEKLAAVAALDAAARSDSSTTSTN